MAGGFTPSDVVNQALDAIGRSPDAPIDIEDGSDAGKVMLRAYLQCLRQLLRAANWNFARKQAPMLLLADASGNTPDVGTVVPYGWLYEYAMPEDCVKARFVPWNYLNPATAIPAGNIQTPSTPQTTGLGTLPVPFRPIPAKFLVTSDFNYPPATPGDYETPGVSPVARTVICTNVNQAQLVYTAVMAYPSLWDPQFRAAMVAYLASEVALPLWVKEDRKFGLQVRDEQIGIVRSKVVEARIADGNEGTYSSDISVDWMRTRYQGGPGVGPWGAGWASGGPGWGGDGGVWGYGYDTLAVASGAVF